jgi:hypothetical protein
MNQETKKLLGVLPHPINNNHPKDPQMPVVGLLFIYFMGILSGISFSLLVSLFL